MKYVSKPRKSFILHLATYIIMTTFAPETKYFDYRNIKDLLRDGDTRILNAFTRECKL